MRSRSMRSRSFGFAAVVAALLVVGAVVAGCGSSDDTSSTSTAAALSKEDFLAQGNQICADGNATIDAAGKAMGKDPSQADLDQFVSDTMVPTIQGEIDGIDALGAPEGDEDQVTAITDAAQTALDEVSDDPSALTSGDPFKEANDLAIAYGLTECGG